MDNNMFDKTEGNSGDGNVSETEVQNVPQTDTEDKNPQAEKPEQAGQYSIGSKSCYSEDPQNVQNVYSGTGMSSPNTNDQSSQSGQDVYGSAYSGQSVSAYSSAQDGQNGQSAYSSAYEGQNSQSVYSSAYDSQNSQSIYSSAYGSQSGQNAYSYVNSDTQNAQNGSYASNPYSYGGQNGQNTYSYGTQNDQGQTNFQNPYAAPSYGQSNTGYQGYKPELEEPVAMGEWLLLQCLLSFIPCVGLILAIVWAFSKTEKQSKVNFCKAYLIVVLIRLVLSLFIILMWGGVILAALEGLY